MSRCRTMLEIDRKREITGLERLITVIALGLRAYLFSLAQPHM